MRCPNCQTENPDRAVACQKCGARLVVPTPPTDRERAQRFLDDAFRLSEEGKLTEAIAHCQRAIAANPDSTSAYSLLGILYERGGQRELAIQAYERALRLSPESAADRQSLEQLLSRPEPPPFAVPARPAPRPPLVLPIPPLPTRRRALAPIWYVVAAAAVVLIALSVYTVRMWHAVSGSPRVARAPTAAAPVLRPARESPTPPLPVAPVPAAMMTAPGLAMRAPMLPPPVVSAVAVRQPAPTQPLRPQGPVVLITVPAPQSFIRQPPAPGPTAPIAASFAAGSAPVSADAARLRYFQGDLTGAISAYERVTADPARGRAVVYGEMGWLYYQAGRRRDAANAYRESIERYRRQFAAGQDVQAADHGIRTAEAALRVLELE